MDIVTTLPLVSSICAIVLGVTIIFKDHRSKINRIFFVFAISIFIWLFATFMMFRAETESQALFWDKVVYIGVIFIPSLLYHFIAVFIEKEKEKRPMVLFGYGLSCVFLLLNVSTDLFVDGVNKFGWGVHSKAQIFHHFFLIFFFAYILLLFRNLFVFNKSAAGTKKEQSRYLFMSLLTLNFGALAFLPAYNINAFGIYPFTYLSGLLFTFMLGYTIVRHRLLDIRFVLRKSSVYGASLLSIFILVGLVKLYLQKFQFSALFDFWVDFAVLVVAIFLFPILRSYFLKIANKYFFTSLYDSQKVIAQLGDQLSTTLDIDRIYLLLHRTLKKTFHLNKFGIVMLNEAGTEYVAKFNKGFKVGKRRSFEVDPALEKIFLKKGKSIVVEELKSELPKFDSHTRKTIEMLADLKVSILTPLEAKKKSVGLLVVGQKEYRGIYSDEDLQLLQIIGTQAAISIENAMLYEEVKAFNERLEKEVQEATAELREANGELKDMNQKLELAYEKLHKLDRAKSEFLSIASHQLRTPLTSIKGFTSLLLEGTYGKISSNVKTTLEKVFISNERLIKLVEDLLNISRIESGKMAFEFHPDDVGGLIEEVVDSMKIAAKSKGLKLAYRKRKDPIEQFNFDRTKLREVISNLIDNAIKYTKAGLIEIEAEDGDNVLRIIVSDSGMGISKGELEYIFDRFQRGKDVNQVHTEGVGLGLYVCRKIVEAHEGKLWAESEGYNKGSRFIIELKKNLKATNMPKISSDSKFKYNSSNLTKV